MIEVYIWSLSLVNISRCWKGNIYKDIMEDPCPQPTFCPLFSSICLFLSCNFYNKPVNVSKLFS